MKKPILEMRNVTRTFTQGGEAVSALKDANIKVYAGELIAVIGPSGSGKSTFLTIAGGLQSPTEGTVIIDGEETKDLNLKELSKLRLNKVGFILQASNLVPYLKIKDQLKLLDIVSKRKTNQKNINQLFKELSIEKLKEKYPTELSGGERQRATIAKVLYGNSNLILADEPTASLDTEKAYDVVKLLAKETHHHKKATIMVTHDTRLIEYCDRVFEMSDGILKEK